MGQCCARSKLSARGGKPNALGRAMTGAHIQAQMQQRGIVSHEAGSITQVLAQDAFGRTCGVNAFAGGSENARALQALRCLTGGFL
jgi:hypothetical protein